jgi:hypothetical protein
MRAAALSPNSKVLARTGQERDILLLDTETCKVTRTLTEPLGDFARLAFTADGRALLGWSRSKRLVRWDLETGRRQETPCEGLPDYAFAVVFSPDRRLLAFGDSSGDLILTDVASGREVHRLANAGNRGQADAVFHVSFSPDGRTLAWAGSIDGVVRLSEVVTGKERHRLTGHRGAVQTLEFDATGTRLATGGYDTTCLVWDLMGPISWDKAPPGPLDAAALSACWEDLAGADAARAYLAIRKLVADPARAAPFLGRQLPPVEPADKGRVARLIADLDADDFLPRDRAALELEKLGEIVLGDLRAVLAGKPSLEMRRRTEQLVQKAEALTPDRLRAVRAVEALEYMATPEARQILKTLAGGAARARQSIEAAEALARHRW